MGALLLSLPAVPQLSPAHAWGGQGGTTCVWHSQELAELSQGSWSHTDPLHFHQSRWLLLCCCTHIPPVLHPCTPLCFASGSLVVVWDHGVLGVHTGW